MMLKSKGQEYALKGCMEKVHLQLTSPSYLFASKIEQAAFESSFPKAKHDETSLKIIKN
jgi:hypothetical protein